MKKLKKALVLVTTLALAVTAAACSGGTKEGTAAEGSDAAAKKYTIATDTVFAPFEFTDASNNFVGIDMDILEAIAKDQGFEYEINSLGFDAAILAVEAGQADGVIAGMSITDKRKNTYDFSTPYYEADVTMGVAQGSDVASYEDLSGKKVAVKTGTNGADFAKSIADQYGFEITEFSDSPTMYQDVIVGNTVACFEDYPVMAYNIQQGAKLEMPGDIREAGSSYGFAVKKGENAELLEMFNKGLENIKADGTYDAIIDKYTK
ncbi:transporter substrate-binding domain-containing protein [Konateibacter massiliensis]|uniref:transporter substrate-binding domain-containing protein n=1 Tax=Konateibacter massiliensis TaxID=2002841 RepID=UPI000C15DE20|nr:transporter substrate-binding domain-containing protein [Konateibacter massiliensis]